MAGYLQYNEGNSSVQVGLPRVYTTEVLLFAWNYDNITHAYTGGS
jgi:hypothetical protein